MASTGAELRSQAAGSLIARRTPHCLRITSVLACACILAIRLHGAAVAASGRGVIPSRSDFRLESTSVHTVTSHYSPTLGRDTSTPSRARLASLSSSTASSYSRSSRPLWPAGRLPTPALCLSWHASSDGARRARPRLRACNCTARSFPRPRGAQAGPQADPATAVLTNSSRSPCPSP